ncbi:MAG: transcription elongation factor Spt5 [Euryarchaeota archaeon]|nr:transcription elongation factor Spt5 [Euryarchaeota archaeon]
MAEEKEAKKLSVYALRTTIGQEKNVADMLAARVKVQKLNISSILVPEGLKGYVLVEAPAEAESQLVAIKIPHARGIVTGITETKEVSHFLEPKPVIAGIEEGYTVELISGPFKGEKARVIRVDKSKEEITVELFEATVPIPVTVRGDHVRVLEKEKEVSG